MTVPTLITTLAVGAALLALWCYVRWPDAAPTTFARALIHGLFAFVVLRVAASGLGVAIDLSENLAALALLAFVVPALTYCFLASIWVLRLFAATLKPYT